MTKTSHCCRITLSSEGSDRSRLATLGSRRLLQESDNAFLKTSALFCHSKPLGGGLVCLPSTLWHTSYCEPRTHKFPSKSSLATLCKSNPDTEHIFVCKEGGNAELLYDLENQGGGVTAAESRYEKVPAPLWSVKQHNPAPGSPWGQP